jgi:hypothetical protein
MQAHEDPRVCAFPSRIDAIVWGVGWKEFEDEMTDPTSSLLPPKRKRLQMQGRRCKREDLVRICAFPRASHLPITNRNKGKTRSRLNGGARLHIDLHLRNIPRKSGERRVSEVALIGLSLNALQTMDPYPKGCDARGYGSVRQRR